MTVPGRCAAVRLRAEKIRSKGQEKQEKENDKISTRGIHDCDAKTNVMDKFTATVFCAILQIG